MQFAMLMHRMLVLFPQALHDKKWAHLLVLGLFCTLQVDQRNEAYEITAQRIALRMPIVTPVELDIMEDLCILNTNPIKRILYDTDKICTDAVKEFFYERMDHKNNP